jgi:putative selenium metabolism protein SsnA
VDVLITNGILVTWEQPNRILEGQALYLEDGRIEEIGVQDDLIRRYPGANCLDARGQFIMPGNICAHTHFYGLFARGMSIPGRAPKDFPEILNKLWWSLDKSLNLEDVRYSTLVCLVDAIRHGTTALVDHHASPYAIDGSLDIIAETVDQAGLRAVLCYEVTDRDGPEHREAGIQENLRFIQRAQGERMADGRITATFGLHASLTLSDRTLDRCRSLTPSDIGFHVHVAESEADQYDSLEKSGLRVVDRLYTHGILGPHSLAAHAVHVDARETALLADTGTWVSHQPRSNMNNAVGTAAVESLLRAGVKVCLGNDGFSNAMWEEWKAAYLLHKAINHDPRRMPATQVACMAAYNNAALLGNYFPGERFGVLTAGANADLIFVDYHPPTEVTPDNLPWHIIFGMHESMVTTTIVSGKVLMQDRRLQTLDEEAISVQARQHARDVWARYTGYAA